MNILLALMLVSALITEPEHDPATRAADMALFAAQIAETAAGEELPAQTAESHTAAYNVPLEPEYIEHVVSVCGEYGLDPAVVLAVMWQESRFQADVVGDHGTSFGIMQVKPRWHQERMDRLGVTDLCDPWQAVWVGCDYLAELLQEDGTYRTALTLYRYGELKVSGEDYAGIVLAKAEEIR